MGTQTEQITFHSSGEDFERVSRERFVRNCLSGPLRFEPGTGTAYSNVGYSAIAAIVEYSTSRSFEDYLLERSCTLSEIAAKSQQRTPYGVFSACSRHILRNQDKLSLLPLF